MNGIVSIDYAPPTYREILEAQKAARESINSLRSLFFRAQFNGLDNANQHVAVINRLSGALSILPYESRMKAVFKRDIKALMVTLKRIFPDLKTYRNFLALSPFSPHLDVPDRDDAIYQIKHWEKKL